MNGNQCMHREFLGLSALILQTRIARSILCVERLAVLRVTAGGLFMYLDDGITAAAFGVHTLTAAGRTEVCTLQFV